MLSPDEVGFSNPVWEEQFPGSPIVCIYKVSEMEHNWKYSLRAFRWFTRLSEGIKKRLGKPIVIDFTDVVAVLETYYT